MNEITGQSTEGVDDEVDAILTADADSVARVVRSLDEEPERMAELARVILDEEPQRTAALIAALDKEI